MSEADRLIDSIQGYSHLNHDLLHKYDLDFYLNYFDRQAISQVAAHFAQYQNRTLQVHEFVKVFLLNIPHEQDQTLYLALSLKQLFDRVLERTTHKKSILFTDFTTYLCDKISKQDLDIVVPSKKIAKECRNDELSRLREVDLNPAEVISKVEMEIPKIDKDQRKINRKVDQQKGVSAFYYSSGQKKIIAVGVLSPSIMIYNNQLQEQRQIRPREGSQIGKDIGIMSMGYDRDNERIGALLTNNTMVFWEGGDDYSTEKSISNKTFGDKIMYFHMLKQWVTIDKTSLHFWNLTEEQIIRTITVKDAVTVSAVCEVNHLKALCVAKIDSNDQKELLIYHDFKVKAKISLSGAGCHTLHYNPITHCLIPLGYCSVMPVYTVQRSQFDVSLKFTLRGHKSIITCIDSLQNQSLIVTGDDTGEIRVWELTYMRCVQAVKIARWLSNVHIHKNILIFSDTRINVMQLDQFDRKQIETPQPIYDFVDQNQKILWVITQKDARKIDMKMGKTIRIYVLVSEYEDVSTVVQIGSGFVVGTSRGDLIHYDTDCNIRWTKRAHDGQVRKIKYDSENKLIFSMGSEGKVFAWPEKTIQNQPYLKELVFKTKNITGVELSNREKILAIYNHQESEVTFWNYDLLKLYEVLVFDGPVTTVMMVDIAPMVVVVTGGASISLLKYKKTENTLKFELMGEFCLRDLGEKPKNQHNCSLFLNQEDCKYSLYYGSSQGTLSRVDLTQLFATHFPPPRKQGDCCKESVNIYRCQRQEYENGLLQLGDKLTLAQLRSHQEAETIEVLWREKISRQYLGNIHPIRVKSGVLGMISGQEIKFVDSSEGQVVGSLNINQPLPQKWDIQIDQHNALRKQVFEVLQILDHILKHHGYEMLAKEYKLINITHFMEMIKNGNFHAECDSPKPRLMTDQYSPGHKKVTTAIDESHSLKSLEAYKRVQTIRRQSEESMLLPNRNVFVPRESHKEREQIRELLLSKKNKIISIQPLTTIAGRLEAAFSSKKEEKQNQYAKPARLETIHLAKLSGSPKQERMINKSMVLKSQKSERWLSHSKDKGIQEILGQLNSKLKLHRSKYNRKLEQAN